MSYQASEADRRLSNIVRIGSVATLDEADATVTVDLGDTITAPLPWVTLRAGPDRTWWAPEPGEQVLVLSQSGDLAQGVVLPGIYQDAHPAPADARTKSRQEWQDGAFQEYDRAAHHHVLDVPAGGSITLRIGATSLVLRDDGVTLTTPQVLVDSAESTFKGAVTVEGLLAYLAGMTGSGGTGATATISGNVAFEGGTLTHNGADVGSTHTHTEQGDGNETSPPH